MATGDRIFISDNSYVTGRITSEAVIRATNDATIQTSINSTKSTLTQAQITTAGLGLDMSTESSALLAQVGDMDFGGLTWDDNGTPRIPGSITKAINALNDLSFNVESQVLNTGGPDLADATTLINASKHIALEDEQKLQNILLLSDADKNSFAELLDLVNNNDSDLSSALTVCQEAVAEVTATKTEKLQTINTTMSYTDKTTGTKYKLAVSSGNIVLIEL